MNKPTLTSLKAFCTEHHPEVIEAWNKLREEELDTLSYRRTIDIKMNVKDGFMEFTAKICDGRLTFFPTCYDAQENRLKALVVKDLEEAVNTIKATLPTTVPNEWTRPSYPSFFPDFIRNLTMRNEGTVDGLMEVFCTDGNWHEVKVGDTVVQEVDSLGNTRVYIK